VTLDERDDRRVVLKGHAADVDALLRVLGEDGLEDGLGEHALELLVGKVDAQLLERVVREALEAEDVDGANEEARVAAKHERLPARVQSTAASRDAPRRAHGTGHAPTAGAA
jgi:hypothetical protein